MVFKIEHYKKTDELSFLVDEYEVTRCKVSDFNAEYSKALQGGDTKILTPAVRYITKTYEGFTILYEEPPRYRLIQYTDSFLNDLDVGSSNSPLCYLLPFPWIRYIIRLAPNFSVSQVFGFMAYKPFDELDFEEETYPIPTSNWYSGGELCRPVYLDNPFANQPSSMLSAIQRTLTEIWESGFNRDLEATVVSFIYQERRDPEVDTLTKLIGFEHVDGMEEDNAKLHNFYSRWQALTMDEVMSREMAEMHTLPYRAYMFGHGAPPPATSLDSLKASILKAAQNASLRQLSG